MLSTFSDGSTGWLRLFWDGKDGLEAVSEAEGGHSTGVGITITGHNNKMFKWETCMIRLNSRKCLECHKCWLTCMVACQ